jgi:hypothetical protein
VEDSSGKGLEADDEDEAAMAFSSSCPLFRSEDFVSTPPPPKQHGKKGRTAVSRLRTALAVAIAGRHRQVGLGSRLTGTLYGHRRGHVHLAFQVDPRCCSSSPRPRREAAFEVGTNGHLGDERAG